MGHFSNKDKLKSEKAKQEKKKVKMEKNKKWGIFRGKGTIVN